MQDSGPLIAMIFFLVGTLVFGLMAYLRHSDLEGDPEKPGERLEAKIKDDQQDLQKAIADRDQVEQSIQVTRQEIQTAHIKYDLYLRMEKEYSQAFEGRRMLVNEGKGFRKQAKDVDEKIKEVKDKTEREVRKDDSEIRERVDKESKDLADAKEASLLRQNHDTEALTKDERKHKMQLNNDDSELREYLHQLDILTTRDIQRADLVSEIDGRVILSDPIHNLVCIDRGSADGVKNGFLFECFAMRPGNRKAHKAYLEVRRTEPNLSECLIVMKTVGLPRDPLSDYVAHDPEERYSPYQESKAGIPQELSAPPKKALTGMTPMDPIVVGDYIQNPFYTPGKSHTFYVTRPAADEVSKEGVYKSAIAYPRPHLERVLASYGEKVSQKVDLSVDYIIAQKNPQDDPEFAKIQTLGIPVVFEWELFRFLDQK